jgi:GT2 family glycosyltransferase
MCYLVSASLVIFRNDIKSILNITVSFLKSYPDCILYIINNDPRDSFENIFISDRLIYIDTKKNIGFGAAHNIAFKKALEAGASYHFIINPDIAFNPEIISNMVNSMIKYSDIGVMMPKILNKNGSVQHLPKLIPSPFSILFRKINSILPFFEKYVHDYEMRNLPSFGIYDIPIVSGCFTLLSLDAIKKVGYYDERFFLYFEDWDLSRRIGTQFRTVIDLSVSVTHEYNSGANKHLKLFYIYLVSAFKYFKKWGFFLDADSRVINKNTLSSLYNA